MGICGAKANAIACDAIVSRDNISCIQLTNRCISKRRGVFLGGHRDDRMELN